MAEMVGKYFGIKLGTAAIAGMGNMTISIPDDERVDDTAYGDEGVDYTYTRKTPTTVTCDGWYDVTDTTGVRAMHLNKIEHTEFTDLRIYVDTTSYYTPCQTAGYFDPTSTTGANTIVSHCKCIGFNVDADRADLGRLSLTIEVFWDLVLV